MKNRAGLLAALAALIGWAPLTFAQTEEHPPAEPTPAAAEPAPADHAADGGAVPAEPRTPGAAGGGRSGAGAANRNRNVVLLEAFREEVKRMLQADEETNGYIDEIFKEHIDELQVEGGDVAEQRREQANEMRELVGELRDAQREGDTERVEELRGKITALRSTASDEQNVDLMKLQADMREVLDDEQFERFTAIERKYEPRFTRSRNPNEQALQRIRQVLGGMDLTEEQRERTRELFIEYSQTIRRLRGDEAKAAEAVNGLREAVVEQLDENQAEDFERRMTEAEQREGAAAPGRRPARDATVQPPVPAVDEEQGTEDAAEHGEGQTEGDVAPPE